MHSDTKAKLITGAVVIVVIAGAIAANAISNHITESREKAVTAKLVEAAKERETKMVQGRAAEIDAALALVQTDPERGLSIISKFEKFNLPDVEAAAVTLRDAVREKRIEAARQHLKQGDPDSAFEALLAYQQKPSPAVSKLMDEIGAAMKKNRAAAEKAEMASRKKQGVQIGMTAERVLQSSWGRPDHVNRTITARGAREQWVYPGMRNYLYFENGVLTSIQN